MTNPFPGLSSVSGAAIGNAVSAALLGVVTARFLGPAGQGALTLVTTIVALVVVVTTLGTGASLRLRSVGTPTAIDVRAFLGLSAALAPIAGIATVTAVHVTRPEMLGARALVLSAVYGATALAGRQLCDLVQAFGRTAASIISLAVGYLVQAGLFSLLVLLDRESLFSALACAIGGTFTQGAFALISIRSRDFQRAPVVRMAIWRALIGVGGPTIGFSLGLLAMQRLDRLLLVAIAGPTAGGIYAVAATIAEAARITSSAVGQLLFVRVAAVRNITADVRRLYLGAIALQVVVLASLVIGAPLIVESLFGRAFAPAVVPLRGLLAAEFFMGIALMDSRMLMGLGHLREVSLLAVGAVLMAAVLYPVLISREGMSGAVFVTVVTYATFAVAVLIRRLHHARRSIHVQVGA